MSLEPLGRIEDPQQEVFRMSSFAVDRREASMAVYVCIEKKNQLFLHRYVLKDRRTYSYESETRLQNISFAGTPRVQFCERNEEIIVATN